MARFGNDQANNGRLDARTVSEDGHIEGYFIPSEMPHEGSSARRRLTEGVKLVDFDPALGRVAIHPINTLATSNGYLGPKYDKVRTLSLETSHLADFYEGSDLESILETLPAGFVKDFAYGLGLLKGCNRLIRLIEDATFCEEIVFTDGYNAAIEGSTFRLGLSRFAAIW